MTNRTRYLTDCRRCGKEVSRVFAVKNVADNSEGLRIRCARCGTTNHTNSYEPVIA